MKRLFISIVLLGLFTAFGGETGDVGTRIKELQRRLEVMSKLSAGVYETTPPRTAYERNIIMEEVQKAVAGCNEPYRRWGDGSVSYLGKCLFIRGGIIPKGNEEKVEFISYKNYKVLDVTDKGCRVIHKGDEGDSEDTDAFVAGMTGKFSGRAYEDVLFARYAGSYTYSSVSGATRTIPKYEYGTPITKEEFIESVGKKSSEKVLESRTK